METMTQMKFFSLTSENTELSCDKNDLSLHYDDFAKKIASFYKNESSPLENISTINLTLVELYILKDKAIEIIKSKKI